ncbi:hypothetical protein L1887_05769 [Cichorium endivia]|nr:hypothetical protein L1887_05769 [Cichorium endivia]
MLGLSVINTRPRGISTGSQPNWLLAQGGSAGSCVFVSINSSPSCVDFLYAHNVSVFAPGREGFLIHHPELTIYQRRGICSS